MKRSPKSRNFFATALSLICFSTHCMSQPGLVELSGHVDLLWTWRGSELGWELELESEEVDGGGSFAPDEGFLPLTDKPYLATDPARSGGRVVQQESAALAFTGVEPGAPVWYALASNPGHGEAYPGLGNHQSSELIAAYFETDDRLPQPQEIARPWIKVAVSSVFHDGPQPPRFSIWSGSATSPRVWVSPGAAAERDFVLFAAGDHSHVNWAFGDLGIYRIGMRASAFLGPDQSLPTGQGEEFHLTFAIGSIAIWQAQNFSASLLEDADVSGLEADPDGDGRSNLLEYAFGTDPWLPGNAGSATGMDGPAIHTLSENGNWQFLIRYPRRIAAQELRPLSYGVEISDSMETGTWSAVAGEAVVPWPDGNGGRDGWECVELRGEIPSERSGSRYFRVKVTQPSETP